MRSITVGGMTHMACGKDAHESSNPLAFCDWAKTFLKETSLTSICSRLHNLKISAKVGVRIDCSFHGLAEEAFEARSTE